MRVIKTQLEKFLKNPNVTEFNFGDHDLYVIKELTKDLLIVYNTNNFHFGNLINVGVYDRRKNGFILTNSQDYDFIRRTKPYKNDEKSITQYELFDELKKHVNVELNSFFTANKLQRGDQNDLNDDNYLSLVNEAATQHCENNTVPKFKEFGQAEINKIQLTEDLLMKILEDIYDTAYEIAEEILENNEKGMYEHFFVKDVLDRMEELKNDKSNPLAMSVALNELIYHPKYASYNVEVHFYKGKDNVSIKVKKDKLPNIPVFAINKVSWRNTVLFDADDYNVKSSKTMSNDDWMETLFEKYNHNYIRHHYDEFCAFNFIPNDVLSNADFWLNDKNPVSNYIHFIDNSLLEDHSFVKELAKNKKNLTGIVTMLKPPISEDPDICINILNNTDGNYVTIFDKNVLTNKDFQLKYLNNVKNTSEINDLGGFLDYGKQDIVDAIENAILNIDKKTQDQLAYWQKRPIDNKVVENINSVDVIKKLISFEVVAINQIASLKPNILNDKDFLDCLFSNKTQWFRHYGYTIADFETIYNKLNQQIIDDDFYLGNLLKMFLMINDDQEAKAIVSRTIGLNEFEKRTKIHDILMTDIERQHLCLLPVDSMERYIKNCLTNNIHIDTYFIQNYINKENRNIDLIVNMLEKDFETYIHSMPSKDLEIFETLFKKNAKFVKKMPQYFINRNNNELTILAANYGSVISQLCDSKSKYYNDFLIDDEDFVIKCLKHNFDDVVKIRKPCRYDNNYSVLNEPTFISKLIKEFPDKMDTVVSYLMNNKFEIIDNEKIIKQFLLHDFSLIYHFKRKVYNNEELILDVIQNSKHDKDYIVDKLTQVGSKLVKDKKFMSKIPQ